VDDPDTKFSGVFFPPPPPTPIKQAEKYNKNTPTTECKTKINNKKQ